jgi:hypothetical protein
MTPFRAIAAGRRVRNDAGVAHLLLVIAVCWSLVALFVGTLVGRAFALGAPSE